ncbi:MAG: DNA polymerase I [Chloroflexi bacterium]|nr:DNA polymerase I [Chloroflexota bacterium]
MPERPLIVLLDGNALVHRAYHAIPPLTSPSGEPTNATYGFTSTLLKVLDELKPQYAAVAFDVGRTFRHEQYPEYKATRVAMPDDLRVQLERVRDVVDAFNLPCKYLEGYEADDVLATLSKKAAEQGLDVIIVTGDTDTFQLIGPHVKVLLSGRKFTDAKMYDEAAIRERYGLEPQQLVDLKGLKGDASDNIPGVPGVGEVTATQLLQQFGSIENLYAHLSEVPTKLREKLEGKENDVRRGKELVRLVSDLPIELNLDQCRLSAYDRAKVSALFRELGFHSLLQRLPKTEEATTAQLPLFAGQAGEKAEKPALGQYYLLNTEEGLRALVAGIRAKGACALDAEATSLRPVEAELVGISIAYQAGEAYYIPVGHQPRAASVPQLPIDVVRAQLAPVLADASIAKYAHNANYDLIVLHQHGFAVRGLQFDTMIAAYLLNPSGRNLGLKGLAWQELGVEMTTIEELIGKGKNQLTIDQVAIERVFPYAAADADMTLRLVARQEAQLKDKQLWKLFTDIEMPLVPVLMDMECTGVALDVDLLKRMSRELYQRLNELELQIQQQVGYPFNLSSSQQLSDALFVKLGLPTTAVPRGASGYYSTAAEVLERLRGAHPVIDLILEHRQLSKIKSTYVDALPLMVNPRTGRLHTSWNQTATVTGRISSSEPNLQNIPIRTDIGRRVRQAFIAQPGWKLLGADYSQVELRILAHVSGDENLLAAFRRGEDIHASTASRILGVPLEQITPEMRRLAKTINFGLIYGMSDWGLAARTELSQEEAAQFIAKYFAQYPRVQQYLARIKQQAAEQGYVETLLGRKRYFPELRSGSKAHGSLKAAAQRMAINHPIQGTAADIIKIAMIRLHHELQNRNLRSKMILQVHDELVLEVPDHELETVGSLVKSVMENAYPLDAPLKVDIKIGQNWGEMD